MEKLGGKLRLAVALVLLSISLIGYQNCGGSISTDPGFFVGEEDRNDGLNAFEAGTCYEGENCEADPYMMWLKIRESNPYYIAADRDRFTVAGSCGVGNFAADEHAVIYRLRENFGGQQTVGETTGSTGDGLCILGHFNVPVELNKAPSNYDPSGKRYQLEVEVVGLDGRYKYIHNPSAVSVSTIEVIFR